MGVEGGAEEGQVAGGQAVQAFGGGLPAQFIQQGAEDERPGVVVGAVAFQEIGHVEQGVLEDAGAVAHAHDVIQPERGQVIGPAGQGPLGESGARNHPPFLAGPLEGIQVALPRGRPDPFTAHLVGLLAGLAHELWVVQERAHALGDGVGIPERDQDAPAVGQQFLGVPVGRGHHRLARAEHIGQGAGGDLGLVEIGGEVDVRGADEILEVLQGHEAVEEDDVLLDPAVLGQPLQAQPVAFAFPRHQVGMGGPQHQVDRLGMPLHDLRQRLDDVFEALARPQQAEGEQHLAAFHAELGLVEAGVHEGHVRDAVGDEVHLVGGHPVGLLQDLLAPARHDHQAVAAQDEFLHHPPLLGIGLAQDGVQGRHHRHAHFLEQGQHVAAGGAAVDAELVLQAQHLGVAEVQEVRRAPV